jgi:hypothetical protein
MENKFGPNRRSIRIKDFNYASEGMYYVTLCVQDRNEIFGEITKRDYVFISHQKNGAQRQGRSPTVRSSNIYTASATTFAPTPPAGPPIPKILIHRRKKSPRRLAPEGFLVNRC